MPKRYTIIACLGIGAIFLFLYGFKYRDTNQVIETKQPSASKVRKQAKLAQLTKNDDMVAAILIMPKSYLPALKRFSQSKMAKNIKILRAQLELQEDQMTAVHHHGIKKQRASKNPPAIDISEKLEDIRAEPPMPGENPILATGFLYLLASAHKTRTLK
jgi:hypothetical protein